MSKALIASFLSLSIDNAFWTFSSLISFSLTAVLKEVFFPQAGRLIARR